MEAIYELSPSPALAMEATYELSPSPAPATEAAYDSMYCPVTAVKAACDSSSCPVTATEVACESRTCSATAPETKRAFPVLSVSVFPVLSVFVFLCVQVLSGRSVQSAPLWWFLDPYVPPWWVPGPSALFGGFTVLSARPWWAPVPSAPPRRVTVPFSSALVGSRSVCSAWGLQSGRLHSGGLQVRLPPPWRASVRSALPWWAPVPSSPPWLPHGLALRPSPCSASAPPPT